MAKITLYGSPGCEPRDRLICYLQEAGIPFENVDVTWLPEKEREKIRTNIMEVSKHEAPAVLAVLVENNGTSTWFSNDGSIDVSNMFAAICRIT